MVVYYFLHRYGEVAQLVEQWIEAPCVAGSSPALTTSTVRFVKGMVRPIFARMKRAAFLAIPYVTMMELADMLEESSSHYGVIDTD